jgi:sugar phosphate isomerase/epimerase
MKAMTRRRALRGMGTVAASALLLNSVTTLSVAGRRKTVPLRAIRLGGPAFANLEDPEALARKHRDLGYRAAYCPNVSLNDPARIQAVERAFAGQDVVLAEVGRWVNLMDADPQKRAENLRLVIEGLALADAVGARCCVDIAGSFSETTWFGPHPENFSPRFFDAAVENARKIIDSVKPRRAKFCYEMMGWAMPESPDRYLKMLRAIDRRAFAVHLDPCNLVNSPEKFYRNGDLIDECFDKLGRWIVSCHAKDLAWNVEMNVHFREVQPGLGKLDYGRYLRRLAALPEPAPLMMEHLATAEEYDRAKQHIFAVGREVGVPLAS